MTDMNQGLEQTLALIAEIKPNTLLVLSPTMFELLTAAKPNCQVLILDITSIPTENLAEQLNGLIQDINLVLIGDEIESLDSSSARQVIGQLRNTLNAQILALLSSSAPLDFADMIGLGFKREANELRPTHEKNRMTLYTYDITNYNKKREWNNSRFWANPENFDKFRW
jgi:hypothetical protein